MKRKGDSSKQDSEKKPKGKRQDHEYTDEEVDAFEGQKIEEIVWGPGGRPKGKRSYNGNRVWWPIVGRARQIAKEYTANGIGISLRQLHYRLLSEPRLAYRNTKNDYDYLSERRP